MMQPESYADSEVGRVQCPRCGEQRRIALASNNGRSVEYAGVCQSALPAGTGCGDVLRLEVIAPSSRSRSEW